MITDQETDFVYLSDQLYKKHPRFHEDLIQILDQYHIPHGIIEGTKDIWCRDYMPIQVSNNKFVQFRYNPDYLVGYEDLQTDTNSILTDIGLNIVRSEINLDGGNVIKSKNKVILTDKIFKENPKYSQPELIKELQQLFETEEIIIIPRAPYDIFGHADGMVRFLDDDRVLISDFRETHSRSWLNRFYDSLKKHNLKYYEIPYTEINKKNADGIYSASGCFINYLHVDDLVVIPIFTNCDVKWYWDDIRDKFRDYKTHLIYADEVADDGGVLNCLSWTICKYRIPMISELQIQLKEIKDYSSSLVGTLDRLEQMETEIFLAALDIATKGVWKEMDEEWKYDLMTMVDHDMFKNSGDPNVAALADLIRKIRKTVDRISGE
jgi:agmatine deiminase